MGWVIKGKMMAIHRGTKAFWAKVGSCGAVLTVFWSPEVGSTINQQIQIDVELTLIACGSGILKIEAVLLL